MDVIGVVHQRRQLRPVVGVQQGQLRTLVAVVVVLYHYTALTGQVPPRAGARQRGQRGGGAIDGDLHQLYRTGVVPASEHPAGVVDVEGAPGAGVEQLGEVHAWDPNRVAQPFHHGRRCTLAAPLSPTLTASTWCSCTTLRSKP